MTERSPVEPRDAGGHGRAHTRRAGRRADWRANEIRPRSTKSDFADVKLVPWDELPSEVRAAIGHGLPERDAVFACPRRDRRGRRGRAIVEWWWIDANGELVEAFWFE